MRKIIKNKVYDTVTAKLRGTWDNGLAYPDLNYCEEWLLQKKTGEFFLYGIGGPLSKYAETRGQNTWAFGRQITPLSEDAARRWAEEHLSAEKYEELFGPVVEDDSRVVHAFSLAADSLEILRRKTRETGRPMGAILDELIKAM